MRATKGNKEYMIDGSQQKRYQDAGFDILNELGQSIFDFKKSFTSASVM